MEMINGFPCKNCTDVDYAKKFIDPAHPKDGPHGADSAKSKQAAEEKAAQATGRGDQTAVHFGGALAGLTPAPEPARTGQTGARLDVSV